MAKSNARLRVAVALGDLAVSGHPQVVVDDVAGGDPQDGLERAVPAVVDAAGSIVCSMARDSSLTNSNWQLGSPSCCSSIAAFRWPRSPRHWRASSTAVSSVDPDERERVWRSSPAASRSAPRRRRFRTAPRADLLDGHRPSRRRRAARRGLTVSNTPTYCTEEVADHALACVLAGWRGLWTLGSTSAPARGSRARCCGGSTPAPGDRRPRADRERAGARARRSGSRWSATTGARRRAGSAAGCHSMSCWRPPTRCRCICPGTPGAPPLLGRGEIASIKPGAVLVNLSRASLVDLDAVVAALESARWAARRSTSGPRSRPRPTTRGCGTAACSSRRTSGGPRRRPTTPTARRRSTRCARRWLGPSRPRHRRLSCGLRFLEWGSPKTTGSTPPPRRAGRRRAARRRASPPSSRAVSARRASAAASRCCCHWPGTRHSPPAASA